MSDLLSVKDALNRILDGVSPQDTEAIALADAQNRVLADPLASLRTQPPFHASAMDGYAVRASDVANTPCTLKLIGESAAGLGYSGVLHSGEACRIFTGAPLPDGSDTIVIQENVLTNDDGRVEILEGAAAGKYVRKAGLDFHENDELIGAGTVLDAGALSLAAAMNHGTLTMRAKPKVAIIATGNELVEPGSCVGPDQIVASNTYGVSALVNSAGGSATDMGIAKDELADLEQKFEAANALGAEIIVTLGGASVGDHDLVQQALAARGVDLNFWKLAMRPGKPVMFGMSEHGSKTIRYIGLPGNPVSSLVCTTIFIVPLIRKMLGLPFETLTLDAVLGADIPQNDMREEYMRATTRIDGNRRVVTPVRSQDSSIIHLYHQADCLIIRPAHSPRMPIGSACKIIKI